MKPLLFSTLALSLFCLRASAQTPTVAPGGPAAGTPVHVVVTAEPLQGAQAPAVALGDVTAWQGRNPLPLKEWIPLQGDKADLELYILIDERIDPAQTMLFDQLRRFVLNQPPSTAVGIAYMFNGEAHIARTPTTDHALAADALRNTSGAESAEASPFTSLSALVNGWPAGATRREVLAVTDGIDRFGDFGDMNMYVDQSVADAQRNGVEVYCLYAHALGHASHSPALIRWGQTYLAQIAEETGGEAYLMSPTSPGSVEQSLSDLQRHLAHQYLATIVLPPGSGAGYQQVRFTTNDPNVDLTSTHGVYGHAPVSVP
jgi:hypothetical protein